MSLLCCSFLTIYGHDWVGGIIGGTTVVALVSAFVIGRTGKEE